MKTKFLIFVISFVFVMTAYAPTIYAFSNEIVQENSNESEQITNETIEETSEKMEEIIDTEEENELENQEIPKENEEENLLKEDEKLLTEVTASENYQGVLCIDYPQYNQSFLRPNQEIIKLQGWAVSNDYNDRLQVFVDNQEVQLDMKRMVRSDVDKLISTNYGGVTKTPLSGFYSEMNMTQFSAGAHILKIQLLANNGQILSFAETRLNIQNQTFSGLVCIDTPIGNTTYVRPDNFQITINGWAVANDSNSSLRILVDGKEVANNITRTERSDIDRIISPNYGGKAVTPESGFSQTISTDDFNVGRHIVRVEEISRYGQILSISEKTIYIQNKSYMGLICIDVPTNNSTYKRPDNTQIQVAGWAVSNDNNSSIKILVDGKEMENTVTRYERTDIDKNVSSSYGGKTLTPKAGFFQTIDISNLNAGMHVIRVEQNSRYNQKLSMAEKTIYIQNKSYSGLVCIDAPRNNTTYTRPDNTQITITGWAVSNDSNSSLRILVDGKEVTNNVARTERIDVDKIISPSYGGKVVTPRAGFSQIIDITNLGVGAHLIRVEERSRYSEMITYSDFTIQVVNKKYNGEMCLDLPTANKTYKQGEKITISGWATSQDKEASVEIYIDNTLVAMAERYARSDVAYFVEKYDWQTLFPGFGKMIESTNLSVGNHKLAVYEKSRYGDIIGGIEIPIIIKSNNIILDNDNNNNNTITAGTKGIDVSQFQGNINWQNVANSGIKFAMIRIGYRGYGNGGLVEDSKFQRNFLNASKNGLKVGVYFYSTAINVEEAKKDAEYVVSLLKKYGYQSSVTMPIAMDLELVSGVNTRDKNVSKSVRTNIANAFCSTIASYGYTPMIYACTSFLNGNLNTSQIPYDIWVAQYNSKCTYSGKYTMWQYSSTGKVSGITGNVDCNNCYKNY